MPALACRENCRSGNRKNGAPVYVRHEIVHNKRVVDDLAAKGAVFVKELDEVPTGAPVVFSAHGVAKSVHERADALNMIAVDATCPLVTKVHNEAARHVKHDKHILLIGHAGHPEVIGTMGQSARWHHQPGSDCRRCPHHPAARRYSACICDPDNTFDR